MKLACGQKIVVKSPFNDNFVTGRIVSFFHLNEDEASFFRKRAPIWENVKAGDRAFRFDTPDGVERNFDPRVFIIGYDEMFVATR